MVAKVANVTVFPIKSAKGLSLSQAWLETAGLSFDRRFMIALMDGSMITSRRYPQLLLITTVLTPDRIIFSYPDMPPLILSLTHTHQQWIDTAVWNDKFQALTTTAEANQWVSQIIGLPAQLLYNGQQSRRIGGKAQVNVSFADNFPIMIISKASLDALNARCQEQHSIDKFRANLVVSGVDAFAEDTWKRIRIGEVELEIKAPCSRCSLVNIDPQDAHRDPANEPLSTLMSFRTDTKVAGNVNFGMNAIVIKEGVIKQNDVIEVLEYRQPEIYNDISANITSETAVVVAPKKVKIHYNDTEFEGNNQQSLLEQIEQQGLEINNGCRAGLCGRCKVKLIQGSVDQPSMPALTAADNEQDLVLSCCSTPQTDVILQQ